MPLVVKHDAMLLKSFYVKAEMFPWPDQEFLEHEGSVVTLQLT